MTGTSPITVCMITACLFAAFGAADAATHRVPSEYPTIQAAVDAAETGDTVLVAPGTYRGPGNRRILLPNREIVVTTEAGPEFTILDVEGSSANPGRGFLVDSEVGPGLVLEGFTIENGWMSTEESLTREDAGGATGGRARATDGALHDLSAGGVKINFGAPTIRNLVIRRCHSEYTGGGMSIEASASPTISNVLIHGCSSGIQGGAISIETGAVGWIENCVFVGNRAPIGGGVANHSTVNLRNCTIAGNQATFGGGIAVFTFTQGNYDRVVVWGNCATSQGDELWVDVLGSVNFTCSVVDSSGAYAADERFIEWGEDLVASDPLFCEPRHCTNAPFEGGDYTLAEASPCLPIRSPCGALVGALDTGICVLPPAVFETSWGRIKALFDRERDDP